MLLICRDLGGGGNYLLNALVFSVKKEARSFLKVKMREEMLRPDKKMGNSRQRGEMERLGTYCVMTDCFKCPREVLCHAFKMRLVRVVCFSPQLCLAAQVQVQSSEELNLTRVLPLPNELKNSQNTWDMYDLYKTCKVKGILNLLGITSGNKSVLFLRAYLRRDF